MKSIYRAREMGKVDTQYLIKR